MPKFYWIDESLAGLGGHHAALASIVLPAAERAGHTIVVAAHRDFNAAAAGWPSSWHVESSLPGRIYDDPLLSPEGEETRTGKGEVSRWINWRERAKLWKSSSRRAKWQARHAAALANLFNAVPLASGDTVVFAAASELALAALADVVDSITAARNIDWRFLFHFNLAAGRRPDYARQTARLDRWREVARRLSLALPADRIHWRTTTPQLAEQYRLLDAGAVSSVPYPVDPALASEPLPRSSDAGTKTQPRRAVFAGDARLEKGFHHLAALSDQFANELAAGQLHLAIQASFPFRLPCRRRNQPLVDAREALARHGTSQVELFTKPLSPTTYRGLIRSADFGILPYEPHHYYPRCSGVLLEMLACGAPVIVPAGGWMSVPIEAATTRWLAERLASAQPLATATIPTRDACIGLPAAATHLGATNLPPTDAAVDPFIRWSATFMTANGERRETQVVSCETSPLVAFHLREGDRAVTLSAESAYRHAPLDARQTRIHLVQCASARAAGPSAAAGKIIDRPDELVAAMREILADFDHYRATAEQLGRQIRAEHSPDRFVAALLGDATPSSQASDQRAA